MQSEIAAGLNNALERGETMDHAVQTFVNAGYNPDEVRAASKVLTTEGMSFVLQDDEPEKQLAPQNIEDNAHARDATRASLGQRIQPPNADGTQQQPLKQTALTRAPEPKSRAVMWWVLGVIAAVLVLGGVAGLIVWLLL